MKLVQKKYGCLSLVFSGVLIPGLVFVNRTVLKTDWICPSMPLVNVVQTSSACAGLAAGLVLYIIGILPSSEVLGFRKHYVPWIAASLLSMGMMNSFLSGFYDVGNRYLWGGVIAQFLGSSMFCCAWFSRKIALTRASQHRLVIFMCLLATVFGVALNLSSTKLPTLVIGYQFTNLFSILNIFPAFLFFGGATFFVVQFYRFSRSSDLVFAHFAILSGVTDLFWRNLHLWGPVWWTWNFVQMVAFLLVGFYVLALHVSLENALKQTQERFGMLARAVLEGVVVMSSGIISDVNSAFTKLTGYSESEARGKKIDFLFTDTDVAWAKPFSELTLIKKNGEKLFVEGRRRVEASAEIITIHDITARKQHELMLEGLTEELKRSNLELENFARLASHDLREPLRTITSFLELLKRQYGDSLDPNAKTYVTFASEGANRMRELIEGLLRFSRVCQEKVAIEIVDSRELLDQAVMDLKSLIEGANVTFHKGALPAVSADPTQLRRVFENLIQNSIKYRAERPLHISVDAADEVVQWRFTIRDNGIGVSKALQQRVFDLFFRDPNVAPLEGTGMGLAVCKAIVNQHGGKIGLDSKEGEGCCFHFTLPKVLNVPTNGTATMAG